MVSTHTVETHGLMPEKLELFQSVVNHAQVGIIILNHNKEITYINSEFSRIFGYRPEDVILPDFLKTFLPEELFNENSEQIKRLEENEFVNYETVRIKKDGERIDVFCRSSLLRDNGEICGAFSVYSDITERKRINSELTAARDELEVRVQERTCELEVINEEMQRQISEKEKAEKNLSESEERYRVAIENSNDGIAIMTGGKFIYANDRYLELYGYNSLDELKNINAYELIHPEDREMVFERSSARMSGELKGQSYVHRCIRTDGTVIYVEVSVAKTIYNNEEAGLAFVRDVSERKIAELELKKAKEEAENANSAKSEFLANMSHEIRTPMNAIMGMAGLLLDTDLDDEQRDHLEIIRRSSDALLSIINDILDFSKIEAGKMLLEVLDFDLRSSIEEIISLPAITAQKKGLEFIYEIDPDVPSYLKGDPGRLRQIILNIAGNAIKFTEKGEVFLSVSKECEDEDSIRLRFSVRDTGIGISEENLKRLFQSFHQVDASTTRKYGGTGLGLVISRKLAELMDGEIGAESTPGEGSLFWFTVTMEKQKSVNDENLVAPQNLAGRRILVVDDNTTNLKIIQKYLETWGFVCDAAWSGEMALTLMNAAYKANASYDLVISDMQMPNMDGMTLGRLIKSNPVLSGSKLVMLSSRGLRGDFAEVKEIGFDAYLTKPVRRSQLFDCLVIVFSGKENAEEDKTVITKYTVSEVRKRNAKILVAEDNIVNQKLAIRLMEKFGYKADAVANGEEAVRSLSLIRYDLVLMDVQMPEMDGLEATRVIRDCSSNVIDHGVPVIAMTAHAMSGDRKACLDSGMDDYITKPINPDALLKIVTKYLVD